MQFCSEKARALCSDREHCGHDVRGDFAADSWCGGFNAGVEAALATAIDLRPLIDAISAMGKAAADLMQDPEVKQKVQIALHEMTKEENQ